MQLAREGEQLKIVQIAQSCDKTVLNLSKVKWLSGIVNFKCQNSRFTCIWVFWSEMNVAGGAGKGNIQKSYQWSQHYNQVKRGSNSCTRSNGLDDQCYSKDIWCPWLRSQLCEIQIIWMAWKQSSAVSLELLVFNICNWSSCVIRLVWPSSKLSKLPQLGMQVSAICFASMWNSLISKFNLAVISHISLLPAAQSQDRLPGCHTSGAWTLR